MRIVVVDLTGVDGVPTMVMARSTLADLEAACYAA